MKEVKNKKKRNGWVETIIREAKKKIEYDVWTAIMTIVPFSIIYILLEMINLKFGVDDQFLIDLMLSVYTGITGFLLYVILHKFKASSIIKIIVLILLIGGFMGFVRYKYQFYIDKELNKDSKSKDKEVVFYRNTKSVQLISQPLKTKTMLITKSNL